EGQENFAAGENIVILDVRTANEFNQGHIPKARNIDVLETDMFKQQIALLPKDKTYLLYCRSGKRSATALNLMKENGFANIKHLQKGFAGWDGEVQQ
ncbi:MAG: rhodanese-like domain-containing protein, partial [Chitinophagaceae bacterium]